MRRFAILIASVIRSLVAAFILALLFTVPVAQADELRPAYLELTETQAGIWRIGWKMPVTAAPAETPLPPVLPGNCNYRAAPEIGAAGKAIIGSAEMACQGSVGGQAIGMPGLLGQSDMLVRIQPINEPSQALRLTAREPNAAIASQPSTTQVLQTYFVLGVEHILAGWDHLLFVIALVLLIGAWRRVVVAATAFTLSHSITLAAAALGFVGLPQRPVEALIALSILFLALEILKPQDGKPTLTKRLPWIVAFLFGLLHGFGFAGALNAIGLPEGDVPAALVAFNVGVEAGQLLVIAAVLAVLWALRRFATAVYGPAIRASAYFIGIVGAYWLVDRIIA